MASQVTTDAQEETTPGRRDWPAKETTKTPAVMAAAPPVAKWGPRQPSVRPPSYVSAPSSHVPPPTYMPMADLDYHLGTPQGFDPLQAGDETHAAPPAPVISGAPASSESLEEPAPEPATAAPQASAAGGHVPVADGGHPVPLPARPAAPPSARAAPLPPRDDQEFNRYAPRRRKRENRPAGEMVPENIPNTPPRKPKGRGVYESTSGVLFIGIDKKGQPGQPSQPSPLSTSPPQVEAVFGRDGKFAKPPVVRSSGITEPPTPAPLQAPPSVAPPKKGVLTGPVAVQKPPVSAAFVPEAPKAEEDATEDDMAERRQKRSSVLASRFLDQECADRLAQANREALQNLSKTSAQVPPWRRDQQLPQQPGRLLVKLDPAEQQLQSAMQEPAMEQEELPPAFAYLQEQAQGVLQDQQIKEQQALLQMMAMRERAAQKRQIVKWLAAKQQAEQAGPALRPMPVEQLAPAHLPAALQPTLAVGGLGMPNSGYAHVDPRIQPDAFGHQSVASSAQLWPQQMPPLQTPDAQPAWPAEQWQPQPPVQSFEQWQPQPPNAHEQPPGQWQPQHANVHGQHLQSPFDLGSTAQAPLPTDQAQLASEVKEEEVATEQAMPAGAEQVMPAVLEHGVHGAEQQAVHIAPSTEQRVGEMTEAERIRIQAGMIKDLISAAAMSASDIVSRTAGTSVGDIGALAAQVSGLENLVASVESRRQAAAVESEWPPDVAMNSLASSSGVADGAASTTGSSGGRKETAAPDEEMVFGFMTPTVPSPATPMSFVPENPTGVGTQLEVEATGGSTPVVNPPADSDTEESGDEGVPGRKSGQNEPSQPAPSQETLAPDAQSDWANVIASGFDFVEESVWVPQQEGTSAVAPISGDDAAELS